MQLKSRIENTSSEPDEYSNRIRAIQAMLDYVLAEGAEMKLAHFVILLRAASTVLDRELE